MEHFTAQIEIIGINPFVFVPEEILHAIFKKAGKDKGPVPVCGTINGSEFIQTLVKYSGEWRLYINTIMLKDSPKRVGETVHISMDFDPRNRMVEIHPALLKALADNPEAKETFDRLAPSRQKEITRYIAQLKSDESRQNNIHRAIQFLLGKERFVGRDKP
jgi:hypothetical protein